VIYKIHTHLNAIIGSGKEIQDLLETDLDV